MFSLTSTGMSRIASRFDRSALREAQGDVEAPFALDHLAEGLAADGRIDDRLHVADVEVPPCALVAVDGQLQVRLAQDADTRRRSSRPGHLLQGRTTRSAVFSNSTRSGPMIFTELSPRTPESVPLTLLRMFCEKFQSTDSTSFRRSRDSGRRPALPWCGGGSGRGESATGIVRLQRHVAFRAVETGRIGAVVGPADLRRIIFASG